MMVGVRWHADYSERVGSRAGVPTAAIRVDVFICCRSSAEEMFSFTLKCGVKSEVQQENQQQ